MINIGLQKGDRAFVCGMTGSGKTTLALALCAAMPSPLIILDTKYDPGLKKWATANNVKIVSRMPDWRAIRGDMVVRPPDDWLSCPDDLAWWLGRAFTCPYVPSIYVDEGYQAGAGASKMGQGVAALWTRGRVFGMRLLIGTQRPKFISRFVISESGIIYEGRLMLEDDRKSIVQATGHPAALEMQPPHVFMYLRQDGSKPFRFRLTERGPALYASTNRRATRTRMKR